MSNKLVNKQRYFRRNRTRKKIGKGTEEKPRLSVFRSNKNIHGQIINDMTGETLVSASSLDIKKDKKIKKSETAKEVGLVIAKEAKKKGLSKVIFDKGHYAFHGRVEKFAEGAREGGLEF